MLLRSIQLKNFLSFGERGESLELHPLNVLIGPNGSGKSNLIEAINLLRCAPDQLLKPIRQGGGVMDWLWKGGPATPHASLEVVAAYPNEIMDLRYQLSFTAVGQRFEMVDERVENEKPDSPRHKKPYFYYQFSSGRPVLNLAGKKRELKKEDVNLEESILSQRRDPENYPEVTFLAQQFSKIRLYREWSLGRYTAPRLPQKADLPNHSLEPDASNLALVLNSLSLEPGVKAKILAELQELYAGISDFGVRIDGNTVQIHLFEGRFSIPATRLSDGTLRYLCLLTILCHPNPPPLVCIEEPELGLHPDVLPRLADLLKEASERCQLIVTTHSDRLIDALSDQPESILVAEKDENGTVLKRLESEKLEPWLEDYRLGELWTRGGLGGVRW